MFMRAYLTYGEPLFCKWLVARTSLKDGHSTFNYPLLQRSELVVEPVPRIPKAIRRVSPTHQHAIASIRRLHKQCVLTETTRLRFTFQ